MIGAEQDIKIAQTKQEVDDFKSIIENFIGEMRDRDNKRDADIKELRQQREEDRKQHDADMKEIEKNRVADNAKYEADMKELRQEIHAATRDIRNFTIASVVGVGAIVVGVLGFIANSIFNPPQPQIICQPPAQTQNYSSPQNVNQ